MLFLILSLVISFAATVLLLRIMIPKLKSIKLGQKILDIGPRWHKSKEGTPTMGGICFIGGFLLVLFTIGVYISIKADAEIFIHSLFMLACGITGFIDDYVKFVKKQNKGLNPKQKLIFQFASAAAYLIALSIIGKTDTSVLVPFTSIYFDLGLFYWFFMLLGIVFTVNSVNLTDGIDGLAASITAIVAIGFTVLAFMYRESGLVVLAASIAGGCFGFLTYNFHPAKIFMGDTGSLFLGGFVCVCAFWLKTPLILIFMGFMYFVESVSVVLQVSSFKLYKKRIFKMTPIHHHFEMSGWSEIKIVAVFSLITVFMCILGVYSAMIR